MLMVIIGAGASFDSSSDKPLGAGNPDNPNRPPLANNLFADFGVMRSTRALFPQIHQLIPELNPRPGRSIEAELHRLEGEAKVNPRRPQQLVAIRYYLQHVFRTLIPGWIRDVGGVTNYQALLGRISHYEGSSADPVLIVTFNYDTLIEMALTSEFRRKFEVVDDYISDPKFKLFKLHGSENWGRSLNAMPRGVTARIISSPWDFQDEIIEQVNTLSISDNFIVAGTGGRYAGPPLFPAVAIPVRDKSQFECPVSHIGLLASLIPKVTKIIAIGWRGAEDHFLQILAGGLRTSNRAVDTLIVAASPDEAEETFKQLCKYPPSPFRRQDFFSSFSDSLAELRFDNVLRL